MGGGSGGHVTPAIAVIREIRKIIPNVAIEFWCDYKFFNNTKSLVGKYDKNIKIHRIVSGKFRRYSHLKWYQHFLLPSHMLLNIRDACYFVLGIIQSTLKLINYKPDVIFAKGGYVCLSVGVAARFLNIPVVIHDSDAHPGLTNRILSKWARYIATGAPIEYYNYPKDRTFFLGVPISEDFKIYNVSEMKEAKEFWGINPNKPLILVTGGGLGASRINLTIAEILDEILVKYSLILVSGSANYDEMRSILPPNSNDFQLYPFISENMASLFAASDLIVARAGATTIFEIAAMAKPCILIPNPRLTGGHQIKNAEVYRKAKAVEIISEDEIDKNPSSLTNLINLILNNNSKSKLLSENIHNFAKKNAAKDVASLIYKTYKESK